MVDTSFSSICKLMAIMYFCIMETLIVEPQNKKQLAAVKAVLKALNVNFWKTDEVPYNADFVAKIKRGDEALQRGEGKKMTLEELDELWK